MHLNIHYGLAQFENMFQTFVLNESPLFWAKSI